MFEPRTAHSQNLSLLGKRVGAEFSFLSSPRCSQADSEAERAFRAWRTRTTKASPRDLTRAASLEGVGFFDLPHGTPQIGVAPNNIELHPVLKFSAEDCHPSP